MNKQRFILTFLITFSILSWSFGAQKIPILRAKRETVLTFPEDVFNSSELEKSKYAMKVDGRNVRITALAAATDTSMSTLTIRYGEKGKLVYVADIYPSEDSASHWEWDWNRKCLAVKEESTSIDSFPNQRQENISIASTTSMTNSEAENLFKNLKQQYWDLGIQDHGMVIMVPQIVLHGKETYIKIWIKNDTQTFLKLQKPLFEVVSYNWKYLVWREKKAKSSEFFLCPEMEIGPREELSFIFGLPTFITGGGIDVELREDPREGLREFKFNIPASVLTQAFRQ
jgi:hypothetical protein